MQFPQLGYSEAQIDLLDVATNFCREKSPMASVRALISDPNGYDLSIWQEMVDLGWLMVAIPEDHGGVGLSLAEVVPLVEQMGRTMLASPFVATTLAIQAILKGGSEAQKAEWLPQLMAGAVGTLALAEAHGDWDLRNISAAASFDGKTYTFSGKKHFALWADAAAIIIISAMLDGKPALFAIPKSAISENALRRESIIDETKRSFALNLDGIKLDAAHIFTADNIEQTLDHIEMAAAMLQSAEMCGGTQSVIDYTLDYMKTRKQFGKYIGEYQALKHPIVNAYVDYEKARSHLYSAAYSFSDQGLGAVAVRMAKAAADSAYSNASDRAVQFHGGFGFTHDCDAGLHRRAAIFNASQYGDAAWHRAKLGEMLFG